MHPGVSNLQIIFLIYFDFKNTNEKFMPNTSFMTIYESYLSPFCPYESIFGGFQIWKKIWVRVIYMSWRLVF